MSLSAWDAPNGSYTSAIPPGTAAFRKVVGDHFHFRTEVVRDKSRCNSSRSEHCECGAIDFFVVAPKGRPLFDWAVKVADTLGIQSVIHDRRVIGFGNPNERRYTGPSAHLDHVHIGLNREARHRLTEAQVRGLLDGVEGDMTPAQEAKLDKLILLLTEKEGGVTYEALDLIENRVASIEDKLDQLLARG